MTDPTPQETPEDNPNLEAVQSAIRFPLFVMLLGVLIAAYGQFIKGEEWVVVAGGSLMALGFMAWGLLKLLYGGEIRHNQK